LRCELNVKPQQRLLGEIFIILSALCAKASAAGMAVVGLPLFALDDNESSVALAAIDESIFSLLGKNSTEIVVFRRRNFVVEK
jgi:hypothetical protein